MPPEDNPADDVPADREEYEAAMAARLPKYRKRPVMVDAFQLPAAGDHDLAAFHAWAETVGFEDYTSERDETLAIPTLAGMMIARPGDWIVKSPLGQFFAVEPDAFATCYELSPAPAIEGKYGEIAAAGALAKPPDEPRAP